MYMGTQSTIATLICICIGTCVVFSNNKVKKKFKCLEDTPISSHLNDVFSSSLILLNNNIPKQNKYTKMLETRAIIFYGKKPSCIGLTC